MIYKIRIILDAQEDIFRDLEIEADRSLEELHMKIKVVDALSITIGKQKPTWGYEWTTSSSKILTMEGGLAITGWVYAYAWDVGSAPLLVSGRWR